MPLLFSFHFYIDGEAALGKSLLAPGVTFISVGRLVWLEEVGIAWLIGVLALGMTRSVA